MTAEVLVPAYTALHGYDGETWIENKPVSVFYGQPGSEKDWTMSQDIPYKTVSPIVGVKDNTKSKLVRPRSVPSSLRKKYDTGRQRPNTAVDYSTRECGRVSQVEKEATRKHNFENHLPIRKHRTPPWQKLVESQLIPVMVTPSYVVSKSKSKIEMTINTDELFHPSPPEKINVRREDSDRDILITQLQNQIDDLSLFLEEERLNHRETKRKGSDLLRDKMEELAHRHDNYQRIQQEQQEADMESMKNHYEGLHKDNTDQSNNIVAKLKKDIEYLQGAFESYKSNVHFETDQRWKQKEDELRNTYDEEFKGKAGKLRQQWQLEKTSEKSQWERDHRNEIATLKRESKKEQDALLRKYADHQGDLDQLKLTTEELKSNQEILTMIKESYDRVCSQLTDITRDLADTKVKLYGYEEHFEEKVQQIDDKYITKINELKQTNIELKKLYLKKCGQLSDEKAISEQSIKQQAGTAKETMKLIINSRNRAFVNIAACDPDLEKKNGLKSKNRPSSAPSTQTEANNARLSAGETYEYVRDIEDNRPQTAKPRIFYQIQQEIEEGKLVVDKSKAPKHLEDFFQGT